MAEKHDRLRDLKIDRADIESTRSGGGFALALIAVLLVAVGGGGWWWYSTNWAVLVETVPVEEMSGEAVAVAETVLDASGYVTARRKATVSAKFTGKIVEVLIEEGMTVEQGQVLARLDDSNPSRQLALAEAEVEQARASLAETEARLAQARLDEDRLERLVEAAVSPQQDLDAVRTEVTSLEARLDVSREQIKVAERRVAVRQQELDDTVIRAPFDGVIVTKDAQPGEMISPVSAGGGFTRTGIGTVVDMGSLEIEVDVNETYINRVKPGQPVHAKLDAYTDWKIPATVITSVPTADRQKATVKVRIAFDEVDPRILPDMGVKVSFLDDEPAETQRSDETQRTEKRVQWALPAAALRSDEAGDFVFVLEDGVVRRRDITIESRQGDRVTIAEGVATGEKVVTEGGDELADGDPAKTE